MLQRKVSDEQVNTMISDQYEIYHAKDVVSQNKTVHHHRDFHGVHATLKGEATLYLGGRQFTVKAGSVLLVHSNDLRRTVRQSSDIFERVYIFVAPSFLESHPTPWSNLSACFRPMEEKRSRMLQVEQEVSKQKLSFIDHPPNKEIYGEDIKYKQSLVEYLIFLNQVVQKEENAQEQNAAVPNERVEQMLQYTSKNLSHPLSLEGIKKQFFVSKYRITREFKKYTEFTFHQYVMKKKLIYTKHLLREYRSSSAVYSKSGFSSYPHFPRAFERKFGITSKESLKRDTRNQLTHYEHFEGER